MEYKVNYENLDDKIDWPSFYTKHGIDRIPPNSGGNVAVSCPFESHTNKRAFSINSRTGSWQCFACGTSGNAYSYLAARGMSKEAAVDEVRRAAGLPPRSETTNGGDVIAMTRAKMTIEKYAAEKHLDVGFLKDVCRLRNPVGKGVGIAIPYFDESGIELSTRYRNVSSPTTQKFLWKKGSKVMLYGLWRLDLVAACPRERVIIVEGESDCHTLWQRGYDEVIGAPGSNTFKREWAQYIPTDRPVYFLREPGMSGDQFASTLSKRLAEASWQGKLFEVTLHEQGVKDPSELHKKDPSRFDTILESAIQTARPFDHIQATLKPEEIIQGFPPLLQPDNYRLDNDRGVLGVTKEDIWYPICPVPVGLARRLRSVDTGEEKVEVIFQRDGQVHSIAASRSTVFTSRGITTLADRGLPVNSNNATKMVAYLSALEGANLDTLPHHKCMDRMGWVDSKTFLPGVAGNDVYIDAEYGTRQLADAYHQNGSVDEWLELAGHVRKNHYIARLMLAASFAAPLLYKLQQRVFLIHAWGPSRGGKTAATKLALSAWGNPEDLLATFNATKVYLEQTAAFYSDLPLGVDELQVTDGKTAENIVYMLSLGKGRGRGARGGGVQASRAWRSIIITTGEQPLTSENSHGGVVTRAVEVYGQPIDGDESLARRLHQQTLDNYGHAGPEFIRKLLAYGDQLGIDWKALLAHLEGVATANTSSHVASVAVCALADYLSGMWLWGVDRNTAWNECIALGERVLGGLDKASDTDYAERAREYLEGWIAIHQEKFTTEGHVRFGSIDIDDIRPENTVTYIIPAAFNDAMHEGGFNARRVLTDFAERGWIRVEEEGSRIRPTVRSRVLGRQMRLICLLGNNDIAPIEGILETSNPSDVF